MVRVLLMLPILVAICACISAEVKPDLSLVDAYTYDLERKEPFNQPFISHFKRGEKNLTYVAAYHEHKAGSRTFNLVDRAIEQYKPRMVILEGFRTSSGISPQSLLNSYKQSSTDTFYKWGEPAYTAIRAAAVGIPFVGGEPDETLIVKGVTAAGYNAKDLALFYFVRQIPQFKRDGTLKTKTLEQIYPGFLQDQFRILGIQGAELPIFSEFLSWYRAKNGKEFNLDTFDNEETSPQREGIFFTQRLGHAVGMVRDRYVVKLIADMMNKHDKVMIVFGKSHLAQQRRALVAMLGKPTSESL